MSLPNKTINISIFMHREKKDTFIELKDRIFAKITGWKARLLFQVARTTLVKFVANAILTYIMSLFLLPKYFCLEINTLIHKFWWGFPQGKNHNLSFLSWDNICSSKALSGLGLRSIEFQNSSLLVRLGWKMITNQPLLWVDAFRGKYLQHGISFINAPFNSLSSKVNIDV